MADFFLDAMARKLGMLSGRRATVGATVGAVLAGLGIAAWDEAAAKPRKKKRKKKRRKCKAPNTRCGRRGCCKPDQPCRNGVCLGPCAYDTVGDTKTLLRDCVTFSSIPIENGITTFDGGGHTIVMLGSIGSLPYGIGVDGVTATVQNLTLDGSGVTSDCANRGVGILYSNASGAIEDVTLIGFSASCGDAIRVITPSAASPQTVTIDLVSIEDAQVGINASALNPLTLVVTDCDMQDVNFGIQVQYNVEATIDGNEIAASTYGVTILAQPNSSVAPDVTAIGNTITGAQIGISAAAGANDGSTGAPNLDAIDNIITGPGPTDGTTHGLQFARLATGSAEANEISNFFDSRLTFVGCGIFVAADAGVVDIDGNMFPEPPANDANEQDICED
jgi:hypothetical protein